MARPRRLDQLSSISDLVCDDKVVHVDAVRQARLSLPESSLLTDMAEFFSALSDPTRLRIIAALDQGPLCVCDLAATVALTESAVSHQLRSLRSLGLVRSQRDGRRVYYSLADEHVITLYSQARVHVEHARQDGEPT